MTTDKIINTLIKAERHSASSDVIYQLLGKYGHLIHESVKEDMRLMAENYQKDSERLSKIAQK